ncbi:hypothetical protein NHX12_011264 [Muraenolepis orangiensis]|uniref:Uncharacterized protein n=1 Tax=Muraenolepis orangiensis TaxID=630683 RepID=A0A9Q0I5I9_9TELE|nr:hypothetical protein NHX12_011264 [Muraenolepis orangiensis]
MLQDSKGALRLLLLACLVGLVAAEVGSFCPCLRFFHRDTPPTGIGGEGRYASVCQRYRNKYCFASLYDRLHRTPLYSAYLLTTAGRRRPKAMWKYEPQVRVCVCVWVCVSGCICVVCKQHVRLTIV